MPLNPSDTLANGQYRIVRLLGRGGFGFVYQAQDTLLHREMAIKELSPALAGDVRGLLTDCGQVARPVVRAGTRRETPVRVASAHSAHKLGPKRNRA